MSRKGRKKKLRITIVANDPRDAKRILDAIGEAARTDAAKQQEKSTAQKLPDITPTIPDEQLETTVNRAAGKALERARENVAAENKSKGLEADAARRGSAEEIVEKRGRVRRWFQTAGSLAYRATIKVVADIVKEMSTPL